MKKQTTSYPAILHVTEAEYLGEYKVKLAFNDGSNGFVNLEKLLKRGIFKPLKDIQKFATVKFDQRTHTICWDNGADLAPEFLKDHLQQL